MKNLLTIIFLAFSITCFSQTMKISEMTTYGGNASEAYVPIVIGTVNFKTLGKNLVAGKIDSVKISNDTLYTYSNGTRRFIGVMASGGTVITGAASTVVNADLTASRAVASNGSGKISVATTSLTELNRVAGITDNIMTLFGGKQNTLVSAVNIKSINGVSILGSGNLVVTGSGGGGSGGGGFIGNFY